MNKLVALYRSFYLHNKAYVYGFVLVVLYILSYYWEPLITITHFLVAVLVFFILADAFVLYNRGMQVSAYRSTLSRWGNGDENPVQLYITNNSRSALHITVLDQVPVQFQYRKFKLKKTAAAGEEAVISYQLRPVERGLYHFGDMILLLKSPLSLVVRRQQVECPITVKVYPSYAQMRRHSLEATATSIQGGSRRLRKTGNSLEFEQIKEYVSGDDIRTLNWKASARKASFMVNTFADERSQQIYCLIDKSRHMKMPFGQMALLDYAINATLVLLNIVLHKHDKAGLITFGNQIDDFIVADRKAGQMPLILEKLYQQATDYTDADYESLYRTVRHRIKQRSLLLLFTNFETKAGLSRQLPYLKALAAHHLLCVIFFENTELKQLAEDDAVTTEDIYVNTIAEKMLFEKREMVKTLQQSGIVTLLTTPAELTANAINRYLEIKQRNMI